MTCRVIIILNRSKKESEDITEDIWLYVYKGKQSQTFYFKQKKISKEVNDNVWAIKIFLTTLPRVRDKLEVFPLCTLKLSSIRSEKKKVK